MAPRLKHAGNSTSTAVSPTSSLDEDDGTAFEEEDASSSPVPMSATPPSFAELTTAVAAN
jgi:hypothetical protein